MDQLAELKKVQMDVIRLRFGGEQTRDRFYKLYQHDPEKAVGMLNDEGLFFPSLFILRPEISKCALHRFLNKRNYQALHIINRFISHTYRYKEDDKQVLQWMFYTGFGETGLGDTYDEIMDKAAVLLIKECHDKACLHLLEEMIFQRYGKDQFTYDAEWALFESRDTDCLVLLANRLRSSNAKDVELARRLLKFIPCMKDDNAEPRIQYERVMRWIKENRSYLYYTGESSQKGCNPCPYEISYLSKYLQKPAEAAIPAASFAEQSNINQFQELDKETKALLSGYSQRLRISSSNRWRQWMNTSLSGQIEVAMRTAALGGYND